MKVKMPEMNSELLNADQIEKMVLGKSLNEWCAEQREKFFRDKEEAILEQANLNAYYDETH